MAEKYLDATGKTIEEAVQNALSSLRLDRDSVSVEILEKPKAGFLGLGGTSATVRVYYSALKTAKAESFLTGIFERMKIATVPSAEEKEDGSLLVTLNGGDMGIVIGRRGETLDAIQYLTGIVVNKGEEEHCRVMVDSENYRAKREEALVNLAKKLAEKVVRYKKNMTLEPMSPHERRIIHATLQDFPGVTTYSNGTEPNRRVVVAFAGANGVKKPFDSSAPRIRQERPRQ